ncbi:MAG: AraC family transcriptional regulator ligand-binding domain-containing protein [Paracoccus sp. (in: a-proteobacteria)]
MPQYFVRAGALAGLSELGVSLGGNLVEAMVDVGLSPALLRKPDERMGFEDSCALLGHCAQKWGAADLGLRLGLLNSIDILGPVALVTRIEPSIRSALRAIADNLVVHTNALTMTMQEEGDIASVRFSFHAEPPGLDQYAQGSISVATAILRQLTDANIQIFEVSLQQAQGSVTPAMVHRFGFPLQFGAERDAIWFDRRILDKPITRSDHAYHDLISRYLRVARDELAGSLADRVRHEVARQMEAGACTVDMVAQALRMQPRSLQRGLQQDGTSFRDLLDDWRRARAMTLITRTRMPLSEISLAVGYADQSIFSRAFQRWYGVTPLSFRHAGAPDATP